MRRLPLLVAGYQPLGLALRLRTDHLAVLAAAEDAFRGFGPPPEESPDLDFLFLAQGVEDREREAAYRVSGPLVRVREGGSTLLVDRARGTARGRLAPALLATPARLRLDFLELALQLMLPPRGFLGVHGAGVVRHGRAALLRAAGGGGKTTLAYAAARGRFQLLAEDVVWIDPAGKVWWGLPWWCHLRLDAGRLFPELAGRSQDLLRNGVPKLAVALESIRPGSTVPRAEPGPVVLLDRHPGEAGSRLTRLPLSEALELWRAGRAGTEEDFPDYPRRVEALLRDQAWRLDFGDDVDEALGVIEELLAS